MLKLGLSDACVRAHMRTYVRTCVRICVLSLLCQHSKEPTHSNTLPTAGDLILEVLERAARTGDVKDRLQAFNATLLAIHVSSHDDEVCAYSVMRLLGEACKSND